MSAWYPPLEGHQIGIIVVYDLLVEVYCTCNMCLEFFSHVDWDTLWCNNKEGGLLIMYIESLRSMYLGRRDMRQKTLCDLSRPTYLRVTVVLLPGVHDEKAFSHFFTVRISHLCASRMN